MPGNHFLIAFCRSVRFQPLQRQIGFTVRPHDCKTGPDWLVRNIVIAVNAGQPLPPDLLSLPYRNAVSALRLFHSSRPSVVLHCPDDAEYSPTCSSAISYRPGDPSLPRRRVRYAATLPLLTSLSTRHHRHRYFKKQTSSAPIVLYCSVVHPALSGETHRYADRGASATGDRQRSKHAHSSSTFCVSPFTCRNTAAKSLAIPSAFAVIGDHQRVRI